MYISGKYDSAVTYSREAVRLLRAHPSNRPTDFSTALMYLGFALAYTGQADEGKPHVEEAIRLERARPHSNLLPYLYVALGDAEVFAGRNAESIAAYRKSLTLFDSLPVPDPAERGIAELGLSRLIGYGATLPEAVPHAQRALAIFQKRWGEVHPYTAQAHANLARLVSLRGDNDSALALIQRGLDILQQVGAGTLERVGMEFDHARVLLSLERYREMEALMTGAATMPVDSARAVRERVKK